MPDNRNQYRLTHSRSNDLAVAVGTDLEDQVPVYVLDLCVGGMRVLMDRDAPGRHRLGKTVYVYLSSPELDGPLKVATIVCDQSETDDAVEYRLQFVDWLGLLARLPQRLADLFNKRRQRRFMQSPTRPIVVTVWPRTKPGRSLSALLCDLSSAGLSFLAEPSAETVLAMAREVTVSFSLPEVEEDLTFSAAIRHRDLVGDHVCYGVFFAGDLTARFKEKQEALETYIEEHFTAALQSLVTEQSCQER